MLVPPSRDGAAGAFAAAAAALLSIGVAGSRGYDRLGEELVVAVWGFGVERDTAGAGTVEALARSATRGRHGSLVVAGRKCES